MITQSDFIRYILKRRGMTLKDLADKLNKNREGTNKGIVTKQRISNLLNGITTLTDDVAREIEKALELEEGSIVIQR